MAENNKIIQAHLLPLDTTIIKDLHYRTTETIGELMTDVNRPDGIEDVYYLANEEDVVKPCIDFVCEGVGEEMDDMVEDRCYNNEGTLVELHNAIKVVFDNRWSNTNKGAYAMDTEIDFRKLKEQYKAKLVT